MGKMSDFGALSKDDLLRELITSRHEVGIYRAIVKLLREENARLTAECDALRNTEVT
jgi:hypothetical protein